VDYFFAINADRIRCLDTKPHTLAADFEHRKLDVADAKGLMDFAWNHAHGRTPAVPVEGR
jgi:hypothetical protein